MNFRTEIEILPLGFGVNHCDGILAVGSCFASSIAEKLAGAKFRVAVNPFGILFNPVSTADCLLRLIENRPFTADDLSTDGDVWFSYAHHGSFSSPDAERTLAAINEALVSGAKALEEARTIIITLGTAWVYERGGRVVANCHKTPAKEFVRRRLTVDEVAGTLDSVMGKMPDKNFIVTVGPVRHLKDGMHGNSISKATLMLAVERIVGGNPRAAYFPSYEIMLDDLRDYRFYGADMVHPSPQAIDYIWDQFCRTAMSPETRELAEAMEKISAAAAHRPINCGSSAHKMFMEGMAARCAKLAAEHPYIDLSRELEHFRCR